MSKILGYVKAPGKRGLCIWAAACCLVVCAETPFWHPHGLWSWVSLLVQFLLSMAIAVSPVPACVAHILFYGAVEALGLPVAQSAFVMLPVIGLLAYQAMPLYAIGGVCLLSAANMLFNVHEHYRGAVTSGLAAGMFYLAVAVVGIILANRRDSIAARERLFEAQRAQRELDEIKGNQRLAKRIHDSITQEISAIAIQSWQWKDDDTIPEEPKKALDAIYKASQSALNNMHEVVDVLKLDQSDVTEPQAESNDDTSRPVDLNQAVRELVGKEQRSMDGLGYRGRSAVGRYDSEIPVSEDEAAIVTDCIRELYANIIRHTIPGKDTFALSVSIDAERVTLTETNTISRPQTGDIPLGHVRHGLGLKAHRREIEDAGGVVRSRADDDGWFIHIEIPLKGRQKD
ncbi:histidine kinase [Bifidobacterium sp. ESL0800]|uniref:sensor histidine kinase n=1 Tax=Bifidobacterium sp. ESL0800 TaxID=2983236 RepID=UPI0023F7A697|nr:histidine kinase [Bifidobacterium sp. ESL0800]WEV75750.1 histidine kinase [Bifidobacterium sp. ESL0800]